MKQVKFKKLFEAINVIFTVINADITSGITTVASNKSSLTYKYTVSSRITFYLKVWVHCENIINTL